MLAVSLAGGACQMDPLISFEHEAKRTARPNIIRVNWFFSTKPWLNFEIPPTNTPGGVKFSLYLSAVGSMRGVFGDGTIHIDLYRVARRDESDGPERVHLKRWSFDTIQAYAYRAKYRGRMGSGYGFRLDWGNVDVLGSEIMLLATFERLDGTSIRSQPKYLKVPPKD